MYALSKVQDSIFRRAGTQIFQDGPHSFLWRTFCYGEQKMIHWALEVGVVLSSLHRKGGAEFYCNLICRGWLISIQASPFRSEV